jgi:hypothetical protein
MVVMFFTVFQAGCFKGLRVCMSFQLVLCVLAYVSRCARDFILVTATHSLKLASASEIFVGMMFL